jgi:signal transduction histidine kinase
LFEEWFAARGLDDSWELTSQLVELGLEPQALEPLAADFTSEQLPVLLHWMAAAYNVNNLLEEIGQGAARMSEIIKALKSYVYLDQAPLQEIDLHEGLENTLVILRHKIKEGIVLQREFNQDVPRIQAYGGELNQVWTNIIDNAIDAMDGKGRMCIRTRRQDDWVVVEIENEGPEIPPEIRERLFTPFFTTKPIGKGTGMGLSISYNIIQKHGGEIKVRSQPGSTCFEIWLPVERKDNQG